MLADTRRELSLRGKEGLKNSKHGPLDVALWNCVCLFELRIEMNDGAAPTLPPHAHPRLPARRALARARHYKRRRRRHRRRRRVYGTSPSAADAYPSCVPHRVSHRGAAHCGGRSARLGSCTLSPVAGVLTSLPPQLSRLENLTTLIVSANALTELPDAIASLKKLRNLEAAGNKLSAIPDGVAQCELLQAAEQLQPSALRLPPATCRLPPPPPPHPTPHPTPTPPPPSPPSAGGRPLEQQHRLSGAAQGSQGARLAEGAPHMS